MLFPILYQFGTDSMNMYTIENKITVAVYLIYIRWFEHFTCHLYLRINVWTNLKFQKRTKFSVG